LSCPKLIAYQQKILLHHRFLFCKPPLSALMKIAMHEFFGAVPHQCLIVVSIPESKMVQDHGPVTNKHQKQQYPDGQINLVACKLFHHSMQHLHSRKNYTGKIFQNLAN
jgi:hypothetical protein